MDVIDALELAWEQGAPLVADLTQEERAAATPCAGWDVDALLDHTVVECGMFTRVNRGEPAHVDGETFDRADIPGAWATAASANVESWRSSGLEGDRTYPFGTFPAEASAVINLGEVVLHAWDLARVTGRPFELDPGLVTIVHDFYGSMDLTPYRTFEVFGAAVAMDDDAAELDRLVALLGAHTVTLVHEGIVVRAADAERLDGPAGSIHLLVDAPATGGRFSTHRVRLAPGAAGASPHHHKCSTEVFFVEGGVLDLLVGDTVHRLTAGDFGAVPPGIVHAFGAAPDQPAEVVLLITPGIERFPFFRDLVEVQHGRLPAAALAGERYDQVADESNEWAAARRGRTFRDVGGAMDARNLAELYDLETLAWGPVEAILDGDALTQAPGEGGPDRHTCWLATIDADGKPHVTGVGAVWADGRFWFETGASTRKGRNLARDARCTLSVAAKEFDLVVEGMASIVTDPALVAARAAAWAAGGWPCVVDDSGTALTAPFSAPSAGTPPWRVYELTPVAATVLQTVEPGGATRFTF